MKNIHGYDVGPESPGHKGLPMAPMMSSALKPGSHHPPSFYGSLGEAFMMPLRGNGLRWLMLLGVCTVISVFILFGSRFLFLIGIAMPYIVYAALLTLNSRFFFATFTAMAYLEDEPAPPSWEQLSSQLLLPGFVLLMWMITAYLPLYWWLRENGRGVFRDDGGATVVAFLLLFLPFVIWPAALTRMTSGDIIDMWNVPSIIRGMMEAPMKYIVVIVFGAIACLLPIVAAWLIQKADMGTPSRALAMGFSSLAVAYCHGVMGAMMGALVVEHPKVLPKSAHAEE